MFHIIIKRFKEPKSGPPPTTHHPLNKTFIFGVESNTLLKYKRIKWTPEGHKLRLFPSQGDKIYTIIISLHLDHN